MGISNEQTEKLAAIVTRMSLVSEKLGETNLVYRTVTSVLPIGYFKFGSRDAVVDEVYSNLVSLREERAQVWSEYAALLKEIAEVPDTVTL